MSSIRFLSRKQIDPIAWDAAIRHSRTGLPYAYSWYLDMMTTQHWSALVQGDYERVFPLPWNRKLLGLPQVYQPAFSQQLGLFGEGVKPDEIPPFLEAIPRRFLRSHLMLHAYEAPDLLPHIPGTMRWKMNLVLPLDRSYEELRAGFSKSLRKRVRKAARRLVIQSGGSVAVLVDFYRQALEHKVGLSAKAYTQAVRLFEALLERDLAEIYQVYDQEAALVCTGLFIRTDQRIINLFGASNAEGRDTYAMHFLLTKVIQKYAGQDLLFDFEGSEVPGVAQFFRSFGPVEQPFFAYQHKPLV
ncbi:MAG TPA: hypothetical protein VJ953_18685 [Saprospiraceae bacterium]|nr:hypothetical protein [Saprospiraceae bacterium]